jgi:hypothetical protein
MTTITSRRVSFMLAAASFCCLTSLAAAQAPPAQTTAKPPAAPASKAKEVAAKPRLSAPDKKAIVELFKDVDPSKYRLEFDNGREVYGTKKIEMADLQQIKRVTKPSEASGYLIDIEVTTVILVRTRADQSELVKVLGEERTKRLNQILNKYAR